MADKLYRFYCDSCGYSRWSDGTDIADLLPYKRSPVPVGIPKYDPTGKKIAVKPPINLPKQFKCPGCGRLITPKKQPLPTKEAKEAKDEENQNTGS